MKKIIFGLIMLCSLQLQAGDIGFFDSGSESTNSPGTVGGLDPFGGGGPGSVHDADPDPAPIDDYAMALGVLAVGVGIYGFRKRELLKQ